MSILDLELPIVSVNSSPHKLLLNSQLVSFNLQLRVFSISRQRPWIDMWLLLSHSTHYSPPSQRQLLIKLKNNAKWDLSLRPFWDWINCWTMRGRAHMCVCVTHTGSVCLAVRALKLMDSVIVTQPYKWKTSRSFQARGNKTQGLWAADEPIHSRSHLRGLWLAPELKVIKPSGCALWPEIT